MITDLEKQFFDTFGIEPKYRYVCNIRDTIVPEDEFVLNCFKAEVIGFCTDKKYYNSCKVKNVYKEYPQITDRILLEMICINNRNTRCIQELIVPRNLKLLKKSTLKRLIENSKVSFQLKQQVQALFEEVE